MGFVARAGRPVITLRRAPNKRLKLAGAHKVRMNCVASLPGLFFCGSYSLRQDALRSQLKRDPLGRWRGSTITEALQNWSQ